MARGRELRLGGEECKKRGRMAGRLAWLAPQPPRDHAPGAPLGKVEEGTWIPRDIGCPSGTRGNRADQADVPWDPGDGEAVSRRAAALLLNFYGPLKESKNSDDAVVTERYSIVDETRALEWRGCVVTAIGRRLLRNCGRRPARSISDICACDSVIIVCKILWEKGGCRNLFLFFSSHFVSCYSCTSAHLGHQ